MACSTYHSSPPDPNGQSHWLQRCEDDTDCGALSCLCGVCMVPCVEDDDCTEDFAGTSCKPADAPLTQELCGEAPARAMCVQTCEDDGDCPSHQQCRSGSCFLDDETIAEVAQDNAPASTDGEDAAVLSLDGSPITPCASIDPESLPPGAKEGNVIYLWSHPGSNDSSVPQAGGYVGDPQTSFELAPGCTPPVQIRFPVDVNDPFTPLVAVAGIYLAAPGKRDEIFDQVFFRDFAGQVPGTMLFWTPEELTTTTGITALRGAKPDLPLSPGFHLFMDGLEVPMNTDLQISADVVDLFE